MGEHKTIKSKTIIRFFENLGNILGYYVHSEYPMSADKYGSQAIDIAWFSDEFSEFPLMIFEIESNTNNSIINNPAKVFGKDSRTFEKPLFFFHIIIDSALNSEKYNDLLGLFGKHNYDLFRINIGDMTTLLTKIICQHRRVRKETNLEYFLNLVLENDLIKENIDLTLLLISIEKTIHEKQEYRIGQIYANVASINPSFVDQYLSFLKRRLVGNKMISLTYDGYISSIIAQLVNISLLANNFETESNYKECIEEYQNQFGYLHTIDFLPGLNRDYDAFILDYVPYYLALCFTLCNKDESTQEYIVNIMLNLIEKIKNKMDILLYHHLAWALLVLSTEEKYLVHYNNLRNSINSEGGIIDLILYSPLYMNNYEESDCFVKNEKLVIVPEITDYKLKMRESLSKLESVKDINEIAIKSLSEAWYNDIDYCFNLGIDLSLYIVSNLL